MYFRLVLTLFAFQTGLLRASTLEELERGLLETWGLSSTSPSWTQWEISQFQDSQKHSVSFARFTREAGRLRIHFWDRFSANGYGTIDVLLQEKPRKPKLAFLADQGAPDPNLEISLNGVVFRSRELAQRTHTAHREIYLGDNPAPEQLCDRLRLAVNDNEVLNPWHRAKNRRLTQEWGHSGDIVPSPEQQKQIDFLIDTYKQGNLKKGALCQMITGMGKTEVVQFFLEYLQKQNTPFRLLWLVSGKVLVEQGEQRFRGFFEKRGERPLSWHSDEIVHEQQLDPVVRGEVKHLFVSMDTLATSSRNQNILRNWIEQAGEAPVVLVTDETHRVAAKTYDAFHEWLGKNFSAYFLARIGLTATPLHFAEKTIPEYYQNRVQYALVESNEIDPETRLPMVSFLELLVRAASRGYIPIPLFYVLGRSKLEGSRSGLYEPEQMDEILEVLEAFAPMKGMAFHSAGRSDEFGGASRVRQFLEFQRANAHSMRSAQVYALSGNDSKKTVQRAIEQFGASSNAILHSVLLGSTGLDLPVDFVALLGNPQRPVYQIQRIGRSTRLGPGKPVVRIVDWTGAAMELLARPIHLFARGLHPSSGAASTGALNGTFGIAGAGPLAKPGEVHEALGIPPGVVFASSRFFERVIQESERGARLIDFQVRRRSQESVPLPPRIEFETLKAYFQRRDVQAAITARMQEADLFGKKLTGHRVAALVAGDIQGPTLDQLMGAWYAANNDANSEAKQIPGRGRFRVRALPSDSVVLPPPQNGQFFAAYLRSAPVQQVLAELNGGPPQTVSEHLQLLSPRIDGLSREQIRGAVYGFLGGGASGSVRRLRIKFAPSETSGFPRPGPRETLKSYFLRDDVQQHVAELVEMAGLEKRTPLPIAQLIHPMLDTSGTLALSQVRSAWSDALKFLRRMQESAGKRCIEFRVSAQSRLPMPGEGQGLATYFGREDVWNRIPEVIGHPEVDPFKLPPSEVAAQLTLFIEGVSRKQIAQAWKRAYTAKRQLKILGCPGQIERFRVGRRSRAG